MMAIKESFTPEAIEEIIERNPKLKATLEKEMVEIRNSTSEKAQRGIHDIDRSDEMRDAHYSRGKYAEIAMRYFCKDEFVDLNDETPRIFLREHPYFSKLFMKSSSGSQPNWKYHDLIDIKQKRIVEVKAWDLRNSVADGMKDLNKKRGEAIFFFADDVYIFDWRADTQTYFYGAHLKWSDEKGRYVQTVGRILKGY